MKIKKSELNRVINESVKKTLRRFPLLSEKEITRYVYKDVDNYLTELSHQTILNAVQANGNKAAALKQNGKEITEEALKDWLKGKTAAQQKRYYKLWKEGKISDMLVRHAHLFGTVANTGIEWIRDNTDIPISPEFFNGDEKSWGRGYRNTSRKPTKEEHDFYRFVASGMEDTSGMSEEQVQRYMDAWMGFIETTMG